MFRIGQGIDIHPWEEGRTLRLGGVTIPHTHGLKGHSDGDALLHALTDAVCGATGRGDIGEFFPDTDAKWKDADSRELLKAVMSEVFAEGWRIENIDSTVVTELPKLLPFRDQIKNSIAELTGSDSSQIGVKATTCEKLGFLGRGEGLLAMVTVLISREG